MNIPDSSMVDFFDGGIPEAGDGENENSAETSPETDTPETGVGEEQETETDAFDFTDATSEGDDDSEAEQSQQQFSNLPANKLATFVREGQEIKIPKDAKVEVKVNGEMQQVSFEDLHSSYASKQANYAEYRKLKGYNDELKEKESALEQVVKDFSESVQKGQVFPALARMIESTGVEPLPIIREMRNKVLQAAMEYLELSDEQRKLIDIEEEREYYKLQTEKVKKQQVEQRDVQTLTQARREVMEAFKLSDKDYQQLYDDLKEKKERGEIRLEKISPADVATYAAYKVRDYHIRTSLKDLAPHLINDVETFRFLHQRIIEFSPTAAELREFVRRWAGSNTDNGKAKVGNRQNLSYKPKTTKSKTNTKLSPRDVFL